MKTGVTVLPLHGGKAPAWLVSRMKALSKEIFAVIVDEYGAEEAVRRISDPYWFQSLSCTLGYDWHSSGTTTVVCGVLKTALEPEKYGFAVLGGKGATSRKTPGEIEAMGKVFDVDVDGLKYASRMAAKVDNAAVQDGYALYHHSFILSEKSWAVVQQGMNSDTKQARRYQWYCDIESFVNEPHSGISCDVVQKDVLDMTASKSSEARKISTDLVCESTERLRRLHAEVLRDRKQASLGRWIKIEDEAGINAEVFAMPRNVNWKAINAAYDFQPRNYEEVLRTRGIGPGTVRALALISDLIYGTRASWEDPVRYSFAFGGKDGVPYPVDKKRMDGATNILRDAIEKSKLDQKDKIGAIRRLKEFSRP
jgi:hypothetical protein